MQRPHFHSYWRQFLMISLLLIGSWQTLYTNAADNLTVSVSASNFQFTPAVTTITAGTTVSWTNAGGFHNVVADDNSFTSGAAATQFTFQRQFSTPGTYAYYCVVHGAPGGSAMSGRIIVVPASLPFSNYLPLVVRP